MLCPKALEGGPLGPGVLDHLLRPSELKGWFKAAFARPGRWGVEEGWRSGAEGQLVTGLLAKGEPEPLGAQETWKCACCTCPQGVHSTWGVSIWDGGGW